VIKREGWIRNVVVVVYKEHTNTARQTTQYNREITSEGFSEDALKSEGDLKLDLGARLRWGTGQGKDVA
jgi:hypothetical protein